MSKIDFSKFNYGNASDHIKELEDIVGKENVLTNMHDRAMRAASCAPFPMQRWGEHVPDVVVLPGSTEEVSAVMKLADTYRLPVVPRGAGERAAFSLRLGALTGALAVAPRHRRRRHVHRRRHGPWQGGP